MLTSLHLHKKSKELCIKTKSQAASLPFIGRVTEPTVKWSIVNALFHDNDFPRLLRFSLGTILTQKSCTESAGRVEDTLP